MGIVQNGLYDYCGTVEPICNLEKLTMNNAEFVNKVLFTGHIDAGSIYADLMTFIYNDPCPDTRLKQLVINRDMDGIFNYAKEKGEYK